MNEPITIVSGLPRSGTSLMMQMLEAGGMPIVADHLRRADTDNPHGYHEFEQVKTITNDKSWLPATQGKAFKMVSMLLLHLPADYRYKIIFMRREMNEILASQKKMLERLGRPNPTTDAAMAALFGKHLVEIEKWLAGQKNIEVLNIQYSDVLQNPREFAAKLPPFLGVALDVDRMVAAVDPTLYRNRAR